MDQPTNNDKHWIYFKNGNLRELYLYTTDSYSKTYEDGNADKEMMESIAKNSPNGKTIFDVGAFIGASSLVFSKLVGARGRVIAFEPNPHNATRLEKILKKNQKYSKNIQVFPYALSAKDEKILMNVSESIDTGHSSTSRIVGSHSTIHDRDLPEGFKNVEVEALTLDSFVAKHKIVPDILKVDVEGAEYEFLLGSIQTIRKSHPIFYIEFHSPYCATKCTELLVLEGYATSVIHEEDDNRVMVLAEYTHPKLAGGANIEKLKTTNNVFSPLKNKSGSLAILNNCTKIKLRHIVELARAKMTPLYDKKRLDTQNRHNEPTERARAKSESGQ